MKCRCGRETTRVLESRSVHDGEVRRRVRECPVGHKMTTYEIDAVAYKSARHDIERARRGRAHVEKIMQNRDRAAVMMAERLAGASCQELADKHGMSVHMARYYTRLPRTKLYPGARGRGATE